MEGKHLQNIEEINGFFFSENSLHYKFVMNSFFYCKLHVENCRKKQKNLTILLKDGWKAFTNY